MKKVVLYIAASLDGYIARPDGSIDWLPQPAPACEDYGYAAFLATVDTLVMGRKTYDQVLALGEWPYPDQRCVVFSTSLTHTDEASVEFVDCDVASFVRELKDEPGDGAIWLVGGSEIIAACLGGDVIDEIVLTTIPVLLGDGLRLFPERAWSTRLRLIDARTYPDGLTQHTYTVGATERARRAIGRRPASTAEALVAATCQPFR